MSDLHASVESAIARAPMVDVFAPTPNDFSDYVGKPDHHIMCLNLVDQTQPNAAYVEADKRRFTDLFRVVGDVTGNRVDRQFAEYAVLHEGEHWAAAQILGARSGRFGLLFNLVASSTGAESKLRYQPFFMARGLVTTKLGAALIAGYPSEPSEGDILDIMSFGYEGLEQIAAKALAANIRNKGLSPVSYPIPRSVYKIGGDKCYAHGGPRLARLLDVIAH